ncbi:hypothetical protein AB2L28_15390 [Kineococcus sp. TBRC 1896]|uniref:Uncharacterized protein n=1 Tax=Kineococcus mangrovi TaxID=1660183 RepID=A0ABV4I4K7_9ACTN
MPLLSRRRPRHVPRHSTREVFRAWQPDAVVDLARGESPADVLEDVLQALDGLDVRERQDA